MSERRYQKHLKKWLWNNKNTQHKNGKAHDREIESARLNKTLFDLIIQ